MEKENKLCVDFTDSQKNFSYKGSIGGLISNTMILIQMLYRSIKKSKQKKIFKEEITNLVNNAIVFMSDEEIEKTINELNKGGEENE